MKCGAESAWESWEFTYLQKENFIDPYAFCDVQDAYKFGLENNVFCEQSCYC